MGTEFTAEQKRYLEGFVSGLAATRAAGGLAGSPAPAPGSALPPATPATGPDASAHRAMARVEAEGRKLVAEEKGKREELGLDSYARMKQHARDGVFPKGPDIFRWKFHGLFYVAPTQDSFMCRLRIPNGILKYWQFAGVADIAATHAGGYSNVTTRANLQLREIPATDGPILLERLIGLGLTSRGAGADNIRNVTGGPTAGIDPQELLDTRPYALDWHHHILADRSLYGLPRKFNVAFDGGGRIGALEDTNDIGFQAVEVADGFGVEPGVWFRLVLGGITGHLDLARDTGVIVRPPDATMLADAIVRVFIDHGDRTDRKKARLKYLLDAWGFERFLAATEEKLGATLHRVPAHAIAPRPVPDRLGHVGVHPQKQAGLNWVGVVLPVGKMTVEQMHGLARIARDLGDGDLRLTVWQNLILSGVADANIPLVEAALEALGLTSSATAIRAGLVACTGAVGCKFGNADTKGTAEAIARHCEERIAIDLPVNIHVTGCHHSCAQHYIGDIGLVGARVPVSEDGDTVEGYHLIVGGGFGADAAIGRELYRDVKAVDAPMVVEGLLKVWMARRAAPTETLAQFTRRHEPEALRALVEEAAP
ncbi:NirA family protein [Ancylobacter rudongensis]|uniref:NAD(P)H-dependent nitrite reductase catalytic subunit n=1 Tax=Ancylobacter rudongensis TaxID=177413 RepID=A0A1G4RLH3_9HYPH|nr:NirA family protein [Ancylobacter rudongensis]SCW57630.1 NAD(P)H-dependent nitrite reductase catalytic subunit [Ancylobacter rudongensis]